MAKGSARPKRGRAAPASLRYDNRRGRPPAPRDRDGNGVLGCLGIFLAVLALIVPVALGTLAWGETVWGETASAWPGGGYGLAATVGAAVPFALAAFIAPLTRMNWRAGRARSLAWAAAALPGLLACQALAAVIFGVMRPKRRRDWDGACYREGHPCWVHVHYPWVWLVGLLVTLAVAALLIAVLVRRAPRAGRPAAGAEAAS
ncbi:hypothetical protein ABZZ79_30860 [Streptomyces sp. NPDC006458]|uniref:hypothetical protein n=1 Tax=Streptomyces sp. NPDC006458 TaxID=3154302 RepID=UPI0033A0F90C